MQVEALKAHTRGAAREVALEEPYRGGGHRLCGAPLLATWELCCGQPLALGRCEARWARARALAASVKGTFFGYLEAQIAREVEREDGDADG